MLISFILMCILSYKNNRQEINRLRILQISVPQITNVLIKMSDALLILFLIFQSNPTIIICSRTVNFTADSSIISSLFSPTFSTASAAISTGHSLNLWVLAVFRLPLAYPLPTFFPPRHCEAQHRAPVCAACHGKRYSLSLYTDGTSLSFSLHNWKSWSEVE